MRSQNEGGVVVAPAPSEAEVALESPTDASEKEVGVRNNDGLNLCSDRLHERGLGLLIAFLNATLETGVAHPSTVEQKASRNTATGSPRRMVRRQGQQ